MPNSLLTTSTKSGKAIYCLALASLISVGQAKADPNDKPIVFPKPLPVVYPGGKAPKESPEAGLPAQTGKQIVFPKALPTPAIGDSKGVAPVKPPTNEPVVIDPKDPKGVLKQAIKAYEGGQFGEAAALLAGDLQNNPDDGQVHYYLGLALKKQGLDMKALHELEKAARLCPPQMIKRFADEQIGNLDEPEPLGADQKNKSASGSAGSGGGDWLSNIGNGFSQMFGGKPASTTSSAASATTNGANGSTSNAAANSSNSFFPAMPDFMGSIKDAVKEGKRMLRQAQNKGQDHAASSVDFSRRQAGEAEIMHMEDMQNLVAKSHTMNVPAWSSDTTGLRSFGGVPDGPQWNYWIGRFKRSFQHVLLKRLTANAADEVRGAAACIFSLDRGGNLHGQVYASTADAALNKSLVEAIRELNHSRILAFPAGTSFDGFNFQMSWNFARFMPIVQLHRQEIKREEEVQALLKIVKEDAVVKAKLLAGEEKRAQAKKLAAEKALAAKLREKTPLAKVEVSGQIVSRNAERELKAVALELKDLSVVRTPGTPSTPNTSSTPGTATNEDPFANIDDHTINSWPDLNH